MTADRHAASDGDSILAEIDHTLAVIARLQGQLLIQRSQLTGETDLFLTPSRDITEGEAIDLTKRLAPYHAATEDMPQDVVFAVLEAIARPDLSKIKPLLSDLRNELILVEGDFTRGTQEMAASNISNILAQLCDLIAAESVWPQQPARTREQIYRGRAAE